MKQRIILSLCGVVFLFLLPVLLSPASRSRARETAEEPPEAFASPSSPAPEEESGPDRATVLRIHTEAGEKEMTMAEYLPLAVAGEMPASFHPEALKAQAVALRSYVLYYRAHPKASHPEADVCDSPGCCAALGSPERLRESWGADYDSYMEKLTAAVAATDGEYLTWEGEPILAAFHASSYRRTETGADLGVAAPYLLSVSSPETAGAVRGLDSTLEVSPEDFKNTVSAAVPEAVFPGPDPAAWVGEVTLNAAGRVGSVSIGGVSVSGLALRQMFALRSTDFTLAWDGAGNCFVFRVSGYGHGLGMSQHGANLMAKDGAGYAEILAHYYPGTGMEVFAP